VTWFSVGGGMCGIVGYIGPRDAAPIILGGLRRLEYRGYDSSAQKHGWHNRGGP
jgi:asparagine synthetase B (glutamine-hydrolysing)